MLEEYGLPVKKYEVSVYVGHQIENAGRYETHHSVEQYTVEAISEEEANQKVEEAMKKLDPGYYEILDTIEVEEAK